MMAKGAKADGFTLHPYDLGDTIPEHNWGSPLLNFLQYLAAWKTHTSLPRWDTESGDSTSQAGSEYNQALAYARRILLPVCAGTQLCFSN
jgi:hypothetical protein